ncbi:non-heme iron oxygenase ferredoxin subunit [Kamptonema cortianum]|nr:non-heme iron oxygenase ferredoxin subunit [Kamptonema cortianum]
MSEFVTVAKIDEIPPGQFLSVEVGRRWVLICNVDGTLYAVNDECTHEEFPLSDGTLIGCEIECVKHGARFDVRDGRVMAPPALVPLKTYTVRVVGNDVQVLLG